MAKKDRMFEKGSFGDYASIGLNNIKKLSESALISEKLLGFNALIFSLVARKV
jgi:hypothetical protein